MKSRLSLKCQPVFLLFEHYFLYVVPRIETIWEYFCKKNDYEFSKAEKVSGKSCG